MSTTPHWIDQKALEVARRFTLDTEPQRRASLQIAVAEAMQFARPDLAAPAPAHEQAVDEREVWVAWTNTDLTEGRGHQIPFAVCWSEATARRLGAKGYVMGGPCPVDQCKAVRIGGHWLVPGVIHPATAADEAADKASAEKRAAVERARAAGLSAADLKLLGVS